MQWGQLNLMIGLGFILGVAVTGTFFDYVIGLDCNLPDQSGCAESASDILYKWQTLVGAVLATVAAAGGAYAVVASTHRQIAAADKRQRDVAKRAEAQRLQQTLGLLRPLVGWIDSLERYLRSRKSDEAQSLEKLPVSMFFMKEIFNMPSWAEEDLRQAMIICPDLVSPLKVNIVRLGYISSAFGDSLEHRKEVGGPYRDREFRSSVDGYLNTLKGSLRSARECISIIDLKCKELDGRVK